MFEAIETNGNKHQQVYIILMGELPHDFTKTGEYYSESIFKGEETFSLKTFSQCMVKSKITIQSANPLKRAVITLPQLQSQRITMNICNSFIFKNIILNETLKNPTFDINKHGMSFLLRAFHKD